MNLFIKTTALLSLVIFIATLSACNDKKGNGFFKNKQDSIAFVKETLKLYPELCNIEMPSVKDSKNLNDTIKLSSEILKQINFNDSLFYKFVRAENYLVSSKVPLQNELKFAHPSGPVPLASADEWVRNYRTSIGRNDLTKIFALNLERKDVRDFYNDSANCDGFRLYFGKKSLATDEISIILTGYKNGSGGTPEEDVYLPSGSGFNVIDDMSKCPTMCPRDISGKKMLGLFIRNSGHSNPVDRITQ